MLTVGVDLAAEPVNTAVARIAWTAGGAEVEELIVGADDAVLVEQITAADKAGIDCPLGWPRSFNEFVAQHQADAFAAPVDIAGRDWRRLLANRETDLITREIIGLVPLSVSPPIGSGWPRCGVPDCWRGWPPKVVQWTVAGRASWLKVYPAAALKHWGLPFRGYKGGRNAGVRTELVDRLAAAAPWLRFGVFEQACRQSDHALDAVVAVLNARAAALGRVTRPSAEQAAAAETEGWIALPIGSLDDVRHGDDG